MHDVLKSRPASYWITVLAVVTVAFVAAVVSYSHITDIALQAGEDWRSYLIPWTFDGVVLAASMTMMIRRARKLAYGFLALTALGFGVLGSVAANIANAVVRPQTILGSHDIAVMLGGFVPLAFLACFHMLLGQHALVTIRPDTQQAGVDEGLPGSGVGVVPQVSLGHPDVAGGSEKQQAAVDLPGDLDRVPHTPQVPATWPSTTVRGGWPVGSEPVVPGPLPQWQSWRVDLDGSDAPVNGHAIPHPTPEALLAGAVSNGNGSHRGSGTPWSPAVSSLPASDEPSDGPKTSPISSSNLDPGTSGSKSSTITTSSPSVRQETLAGSDDASGSGAASDPAPVMPEDLSQYLRDEMYALAAADGITLDELLRSARKVNGSPPRSRPKRSETTGRSDPQGRRAAGPDEGAWPEANGAGANPSPTTPPPVLPSPRQPEPVSSTGRPAPSDQPPTTDQILAYLDTHAPVTVKQAATALGVSESTVYRAKRTRAQGGGA